jgi:glycosyltransferase involved in cell wall biosynthesis
MPTYRHEAFLKRAIESVLEQVTDFEFELLIGEDDSPDKSRRIAMQFIDSTTANIRLFAFSRNVGPHQNMKSLISASKADLIAHCDGDDYWSDPSKLALQFNFFRKYPDCTLVFHAASTEDATSGRSTGNIRRSLFSRYFSATDVILGDGGLIPTSSIMARKALMINEPCWQRDAPVGDYPLALRAVAEGRVIYLDKMMCVYRTSVPHSWTKRHRPVFEQRLAYATAIEAMLDNFVTDTSDAYAAAARTVTSKYLSDVLVRIDAPTDTKRDVYRHVRKKLVGSDRVLSWLSTFLRLPLPRTKDALRQMATLRRQLKSHLTCRRIEIGKVSPLLKDGVDL